MLCTFQENMGVCMWYNGCDELWNLDAFCWVGVAFDDDHPGRHGIYGLQYTSQGVQIVTTLAQNMTRPDAKRLLRTMVGAL